MQIQPLDYRCIGYFSHKLYKWGWQSGLHNRFSLPQHWLLNIFLYYRRGFADGSKWTQEYCFKPTMHQ